jgi:thiol-disulfide isomerase/thioredoxin
MKNKIILYISAILTIFSCDVIDEKDYLMPADVKPAQKTVLLEDYTGMKCPNCPDAARIAAQIKEEYGDQLVTVSIHAGIYAVPSGIFTQDFRTEAGNKYNSNFAFYQYPMGMIDRAKYDYDKRITRNLWQSAVAVRISEQAGMNITVDNRYDSTKNEIETEVELFFEQEFRQKLNLQLWLVEDSIIGLQIDGGTTIKDYVHRHVLRGDINGIYGTAVMPEDRYPASNELINNIFHYTLKPEWKPEHCSVVAFVFREEDYSVIQCTESKIINIK